MTKDQDSSPWTLGNTFVLVGVWIFFFLFFAWGWNIKGWQECVEVFEHAPYLLKYRHTRCSNCKIAPPDWHKHVGEYCRETDLSK